MAAQQKFATEAELDAYLAALIEGEKDPPEVEDEDEYKCQCGRVAICVYCDKQFCTQGLGKPQICYSRGKGVCHGCEQKKLKFECDCK